MLGTTRRTSKSECRKTPITAVAHIGSIPPRRPSSPSRSSRQGARHDHNDHPVGPDRTGGTCDTSAFPADRPADNASLHPALDAVVLATILAVDGILANFSARALLGIVVLIFVLAERRLDGHWFLGRRDDRRRRRRDGLGDLRLDTDLPAYRVPTGGRGRSQLLSARTTARGFWCRWERRRHRHQRNPQSWRRELLDVPVRIGDTRSNQRAMEDSDECEGHLSLPPRQPFLLPTKRFESHGPYDFPARAKCPRALQEFELSTVRGPRA